MWRNGQRRVARLVQKRWSLQAGVPSYSAAVANEGLPDQDDADVGTPAGLRDHGHATSSSAHGRDRDEAPGRKLG